MLKVEKYSLYAILSAGMAVFGLSSSVFGLSLIDFQRNMHATITELSVGMSIASICSCLGSLAATVVLEKWNRQFQYGIYWLILGLITMVFPFCTSLPLYLVASGFQGFMVPFFGSIPNVWCIEMFEKSSKTALQFMHILLTVGQIAGSIVAAPFLSKDVEDTGTNSTQAVDHQQTSLPKDLFATAEDSKLWIPYLVVCLLRIGVAAAIIIAFVIKPYQKPAKREEETKSLYKSLDKFEEAKKQMSQSYRIIFVVLISLVVGMQLTNEFTLNSYLPAYLVKNNHLDQATAAYCQALLSASTMIGRFVNIFLSMKIANQTFLFLNFSLIIIGNCLIMIVGRLSLYGVYTGIVILGIGISNAFAMMLALVEERITMTDRIMSLLNFSGAIFLAVAPISVGQLLDKCPADFMLLSLALTLIALVFYIFLVVLESRRLANRFK